MRRFFALLLAALLTLSALPARAQEDDSGPDPADYEENLSPYGEWVDDGTYGRVWHPAVAVEWQPYSIGQWVWSPYGWTFISAEPWGWTFHYGRWAVVPAFGWVWVPGTVWGPAWVDWYWADGFVGWAPLPPFATHVIVVDHFVFVREAHFCAPHVHAFVLARPAVPGRAIHDWRRHVGQPPLRHRIERIAVHPVPRVYNRPPQTVAPHLRAARLSPPGATPRLYNAPPTRHTPAPRAVPPAAGLSPPGPAPRVHQPSVPNVPGPRPLPPPAARPRPAPGWHSPGGRPPVMAQPPTSPGTRGGAAPGITNSPRPSPPGGHGRKHREESR
jgi:hypothetical protein